MIASPPGNDRLDEFKGRLREALRQEHQFARTAAQATPVPAPPAHRSADPSQGARRRLRLPLAAATASLLAMALVAVLLPRGNGGPAPAAAAVLDRAARVAAAQPAAAPLKPGQYWHTRTEVRWVDMTSTFDPGTHRWNPDRSFLASHPETMESWLGPTALSRAQVLPGTPTVLDRDRAAWVAAGRPRLSTSSSLLLRSGGPPILEGLALVVLAAPASPGAGSAPAVPLDWRRALRRLQSLPTDPEALRAWLQDRVTGMEFFPGTCPSATARCSTDAKLFGAAGALLQLPMAAPALRAALYRVVAGLHGIELLGATTDEAGRPGVPVAMTAGGVRYELIFDPHSSTLLAMRDVTVTRISPSDRRWPPVPAGIEVLSVLYLDRSVVSSSPATPRPAAPGPPAHRLPAH